MARYLKVIKPSQPGFRINHPYIFYDRYDLTFTKSTQNSDNDDVIVSLFDYVRGNHLNKNSLVHIKGLGEYKIDYITKIYDPCPIEMVAKNGKIKRTLKKKDKNLYTPYSNINMLEYNRKSGYINIPEKLLTFTKGLKEQDNLANDKGVKMVRKFQDQYGNIEDEEKNRIELIEGINMETKKNNIKNKIENDKNNFEGKKIKESNEKSEKDVEYNEKEKNEKNKLLYEEKYNKNFELKNEPAYLDENIDKNIMNEIYGNIDDDQTINGDELLDSYKSTDNLDDFDLEYLIKNCRPKFVTGGMYNYEGESEDEDESNENKKGKKNYRNTK